MSRVLGVIPARMGSSRFAGKPLAKIGGRAMIEHVYRRTMACRLLDEVVIATCDVEIARAAESFGARAVMTAASHERATERVAEVSASDAAEIVVMVQGDEPMIQAGMVGAAISPLLEDASVACVNLTAPIRSEDEVNDPNTIKVIMSRNGRAIYFSRSPIPTLHGQGFASGRWFKQVCVIAFRRDALAEFVKLPPGDLEKAESIDMLRFLEHGIAVQMVPTDVVTHAVDTQQDLALVAALMAAEAQGLPGSGS
jgi:3-deoxy-manno-octulosonate cytidylyltransferase (CMP-KDO synthetase)